jgi:hypothetical protein
MMKRNGVPVQMFVRNLSKYYNSATSFWVGIKYVFTSRETLNHVNLRDTANASGLHKSSRHQIVSFKTFGLPCPHD